jgi:hypothetical protein
MAEVETALPQGSAIFLEHSLAAPDGQCPFFDGMIAQ